MITPTRSVRAVTTYSRLILVSLVALLGSNALPLGANADGPTRGVLEDQVWEDTVPADACGFPVLIPEEGKVIILTFTDERDRSTREIDIFPALKSSLTNLDTGLTLPVHSPGRLFVSAAADGSATIVGTGVWLVSPFHPLTGEPGIYLLRGHFELTFDADRALTSLSVVGSSENLCPALAD